MIVGAQSRERRNVKDVWDVLQAVFLAAALQFLILVGLGLQYGWISFDLPAEQNEQIVEKLAILVGDTILKGSLLDFMESYGLDLVIFEPETGLLAPQTIVFLFRTIYSALNALAFFVAFQKVSSFFGYNGPASDVTKD